MTKLLCVLLISSILLSFSLQHHSCSAFSASEAHFGSVTSDMQGVSNGGSAKYSSFFRIGFSLQKQAKADQEQDRDNKDGNQEQEEPVEVSEEDEKFFSEMLLICFNVCSMLLIFIRCYYHWLSWRRAHRKEVDVMQDLRQKAERKLQDIEQQKWKFWGSSSKSNDTSVIADYRYMYAGQSCPICWQEFQLPASQSQPITDAKEEPLVASEETHLLYPSTNKQPQKLMGSDGKPIKSLPCGHAFDHGCAVEWLVTLHKKNMDSPLTCPVCREAF